MNITGVRIVESLKYMFGWRSLLGDPSFTDSLSKLSEDKLINKEEAMKLRAHVDLQRTQNTSEYTSYFDNIARVRGENKRNREMCDHLSAVPLLRLGHFSIFVSYPAGGLGMLSVRRLGPRHDTYLHYRCGRQRRFPFVVDQLPFRLRGFISLDGCPSQQRPHQLFTFRFQIQQ